MPKDKKVPFHIAKTKFDNYRQLLTNSGLVDAEGIVREGVLDGIAYRPFTVDKLIAVHLVMTGFCTQVMAGRLIERSSTTVGQEVARQKRWAFGQEYRAQEKASKELVDSTMRLLTEDPAMLAKRVIEELVVEDDSELMRMLALVQQQPAEWLVVVLENAQREVEGVGIESLRMPGTFPTAISVVKTDWQGAAHERIRVALNTQFDLKRASFHQFRQTTSPLRRRQ